MNLQVVNFQRCERACQPLYASYCTTTVFFKALDCNIKNVFFIFGVWFLCTYCLYEKYYDESLIWIMLHKNLDGAELRTDWQGSWWVRRSCWGIQVGGGGARTRDGLPGGEGPRFWVCLEGLAGRWDVRMRGESGRTPSSTSWGSLASYSPWCHKELDMTEWLTKVLVYDLQNDSSCPYHLPLEPNIV